MVRRQFGIDVVVVEPGAIQTEFGEVVSESFAKSSSEGPYQEMKTHMINAMQSRQEQRQMGSPPAVIAEIVLHIVRSTRPKTRYVAGKFAKPMLFIRKYFGDQAYDRIIMRMIK